jgi:hypothetical protein
MNNIQNYKKPANMIERVAMAICKAAGASNTRECPMCSAGQCTMWPQFENEARAALTEMRRKVK